MKCISGLLRVVVVVSIIMIGAVAPAMACPATATMTMASMNGAGHNHTANVMACEQACLACLVVPDCTRVSVAIGWAAPFAYSLLMEALPNGSVIPELPPPRFAMI